jgi:small subunit ribosomal protein S5
MAEVKKKEEATGQEKKPKSEEVKKKTPETKAPPEKTEEKAVTKEKKPEEIKKEEKSKDKPDDKKGRSKGSRRRLYDDEEKEVWVPRTEIGRKVQAGEVANIDEILSQGIPIMEVELVNTLLPDLSEEVIDVRRVQRTLDSGRRMRFSVLSVVGDKNGHVGVGIAKGVEAGPTIRKSITKAKLNIIRVPRDCSSWECGCGEPHTVPYTVSGKKGSVTVRLKPAPKGVGLVASDNSKILLDFAGIQDIWMFSKGHTRTTINQLLALYDALKKVSNFRYEASEKAKNKTKA